MYKSEKAPKAVRRGFAITPIHLAMIDELMQKLGILSQSDVVRQAIAEYYRKNLPPYLKPSPAGQIKQKRLAKEAVIETMTDKEFAFKTLKDTAIVKDLQGVEHFLYFTIGNAAKPHPLDQVKEWAATYKIDLDYHLGDLADHSMREFCNTNYAKQMYKEFLNIDLENQEIEYAIPAA